MNHNYEKLVQQAGFVFLFNNKGEPVGIKLPQVEAYSNLIVQECIRIAASDPYLATGAANAIKEHFGVK